MNRNILTIGLLVVAFFFAIVLGSNVAAGDYESLTAYAVTAIVLYFIFNGWKNVWWFAALLAFSGVVFSHGFNFEDYHLFVVMVVISSALSIINRDLKRKPLAVAATNRGGTLIFPALLLLYGGLHFGVNYAFPHSPVDYSIKTASKAYFLCFSPWVCFVWLMAGNYEFRLSGKWVKVFLFILFLGLMWNVGARAFLFGQGFQSTAGNSMEEISFFYVPVINMQAGPNTLRRLAPLGFGICFSLMTMSGWWTKQTIRTKWMIATTLVLCLIGAMFSGGRATIPFCVGLGAGTLVVRKRVGALMVLMGVGVSMILVVNLFSGYINNEAPLSISRSLQVVMIEKGSAYRTISGSQDTRNLGIEAGLKAWQEDSRTLITGRSVYRVTGEESDYMMKNFGDAGFAEMAVKSGATHNLISDLLLQYGIIGLALYLLACFSLVRYIRKLGSQIPESLLEARALCDFLQLYTPLLIFYHALGGGFLPMVIPLILGIVRASLSRYERAGLPESDSDPLLSSSSENMKDLSLQPIR